jgi:hypothetical protein
MATETEYDEIIAPMLLAVADKCRELGMTMLTRVEWEADKGGMTQVMPDDASVAMKLTQIAAWSNGNIDFLCMNAARRFDMSQTIVGTLFKPQ